MYKAGLNIRPNTPIDFEVG